MHTNSVTSKFGDLEYFTSYEFGHLQVRTLRIFTTYGFGHIQVHTNSVTSKFGDLEYFTSYEFGHLQVGTLRKILTQKEFKPLEKLENLSSWQDKSSSLRAESQ